jgi:hypothetical protein
MGALEGLTTQQVGRCGELFVQYELLKSGIDSAPMTTDHGVDLVALDPKSSATASIQVKTARLSHDDSSEWVEWNMPKKCIAEYVAVIDLENEKGWLFRAHEFEEVALSTGGEGRRLWWYTASGYQSKHIHKNESSFERYGLESSIPRIFDTKSPI